MVGSGRAPVAGSARHPVFAEAFSSLFIARHASVDGALRLAIALCAPSDGIVPESVLLANGALLARGSGHVRGANTVAGLLIAPDKIVGNFKSDVSFTRIGYVVNLGCWM